MFHLNTVVSHSLSVSLSVLEMGRHLALRAGLSSQLYTWLPAS